MNICTIIAKNYLAQARVLARSFFEHHPDGRCFVLVIDEHAGDIEPAAEPFEILTPEDVGCDEFDEMSLRYDVLELSTAVKPWLLSHLLSQQMSPITYLDPDIRIYAPLDGLDAAAAVHGVVLTPHNTTPLPDDGKRPNQTDILLAGVYNLGYVSLSASSETDRLLRWWGQRLLNDCRVDISNGYFVDQRWFDLVPGLVPDHKVIREPQYNVAYWNLHARTIERAEERYTVDGQPLAFFHFSGFNPDEPSSLSRHQSRIALDADPVLQRLCNEYAEETIAAGYRQASRWRYAQRLANGLEMDSNLRRLYAAAAEEGSVEGSPYTQEGCDSFMRWLESQAPGAPTGFSRLLADVYGTSKQLQESFPDVAGLDLDRFLRWARTDGPAEHPALSFLDRSAEESLQPASKIDLAAGASTVPTSRRPARNRRRDVMVRPDPWGVNVVGYLRSEHGVGEAARQVISALDAAEVPVMPTDTTVPSGSRQEHPYTQRHPDDARFPVNLICVNADMLPDFAHRAGDEFFEGRHSIGLWFWEVSTFPGRWSASFDFVDEIWAPTEHVADAIAACSPIPVTAARIPIEMPAVAPRPRAQLGIPNGFAFLFVFDYLSVFARKNPLAIVEAFCRAFPEEDGPSLVIKCMNADRDRPNHDLLLAAVARDDRIHLIDDYMSPEDKNSLVAVCDCYVSLHRSEGFGLTMAEAMSLGKPVIATGYSGNLDFMTPENSLLVDYRLEPIGTGAGPYPPEGRWAEPDVEHAASLMQAVFDDEAAAAALGARAAESIRSTHSAAAAGDVLKERLDQIRSDWDTQSMPRPRSRLPTLRPAAPPRSDGRGLRHIARRGSLRLMRPFTAHQSAVNADVTRALDVVEHELDSLRRSTLRADAQMLSAIRADDRMPTRGRSAHAAPERDPVETARREQVLEQVLQAAAAPRTDRAAYLALERLSERHRRVRTEPAPPNGAVDLTRFELRAFSQNGEDGVLAEILARAGCGNSRFVEFGVESGHEGNCVYLADVEGWGGLFIEADEALHAVLERKYRTNPSVTTMRATVTPDNVESLFEAADVPQEPAVLSIDVDGADYWIWAALESCRPRVVVIEYNSALDPETALVQPKEMEAGWDGSSYYGASLGALCALGHGKGYRLVHTELCGVNAFFVREDLAGERFPSSEDVAVRSAPNYYLSGTGHPPDPHLRSYVEVGSEADRRM